MGNKLKSLLQRVGRKDGHKDPVCGMKASSDIFKTEYEGQAYYFCSEHCQKQFLENPSRYAR